MSKTAKEEGQKKASIASKDLGPEPKRPSSSYMFFNTSFVKKAREADPELKNADAFKLAGQKWKEMSEKEKA